MKYIYIYLFKYPNQSDAWLRLKMEDLLPQMAILGGNIWLQNRWMAWGTLFSDTHICKQNKIWIYTHKFVDVYNHSHFFLPGKSDRTSEKKTEFNQQVQQY